MEKCARCGEEGNDRRTLWLSCLYDLSETKMPLDHVAVNGVLCTPIEASPSYLGKQFAVFSPIPGSIEVSYKFYTMRICKDCRAEWIKAQMDWFNSVGN